MKVKVIKGKVGIKGERHTEGEVFDIDSVMGGHLIGHGIVEAVVPKESIVESPADAIPAEMATEEVKLAVEAVPEVIPEAKAKPEDPVEGKEKQPKGRKGKK